jgi:hypothetical protein
MHTQNTRINLQRKPAMIDDNDDDDDAEDDIDDDEDDDDADDEDYMMRMLMTKIMKLPEKMLPMPQLPGCNYAEVACENAMYAADTRINTLLLPTAIPLLLYRYY